MFENEIAINQFLLGQFKKIVKDLPEESLFDPAPGHLHPPVWILGHLAITGELGNRMLKGSISHLAWLKLFGPGSDDKIEPDQTLTKSVFETAIVETYQGLQVRAAGADQNLLAQPHGLELFEGTPILTVSHCIAVLLTNHFGFHLAQLSSCRRSIGQKYLF